MRRSTTIMSMLCVLFLTTGAAAQTDDAPTPPSDAPDVPASGEKFPGLDIPDNNPLDGFGSLAVRGVQGTPDGPEIRNVPVTVELLHQGTTIRTLEGELDDYGVIVFEDIDISHSIQPVAKIHYADVTYQQPGVIMDASNPQQMLEVVCYEVTAAVPDWRISMWHVMLSHVPGGLRVTKVVVIENPATETWIGAASGTERATTVSFPIPEEARDIQLGTGFHGWCCTTALPGELVNHLPLMPETTELNFSYMLPAPDGQVTFDMIAPANIEHMMLIVPDNVSLEPINTLAMGGTEVIADTRVRYYMGAELKRGNRMNLVLTGLSATVAQGAAEQGMDSGTIAKIVGGVGAGVIFLIAVIGLLARSSKSKPTGATT